MGVRINGSALILAAHAGIASLSENMKQIPPSTMFPVALPFDTGKEHTAVEEKNFSRLFPHVVDSNGTG